MSALWVVKKGDTQVPLRARLIKANDVVQDLTSATLVRFVMRNKETGEVKVNQTTAGGYVAIEAPATDGYVTYAWQAADVNDPGEYRAEFQVTIGGKVITFPNDGYIDVSIRPTLT